MFFLLFPLINVAHAIYFSMSSIAVTIPIDKGKFPPESQPLATFYVRGDSPPKNYSLVEGGDYFNVSDSGAVFLADNFLESDMKNVSAISAAIVVRDGSGQEIKTSLKVDVLRLESFDCDFIVKDLCFWRSVQYRVRENEKPAIVGSLASPYLAEMCASYTINYNLIGKNEGFRLVSSAGYWAIEAAKSLDRERKSQHTLEVLCTVENSDHSVRNVSGSLLVSVMDVDDNSPQAQEQEISIDMASKFVRKDQMVGHKALIFNDLDSPTVNKYKPTVLNDTKKILRAQCNKFHNDYLKEEVQTAVHCKLKFTKTVPVENWTYSVVLQLNDTTLVNGNKTVSIPIHLRFRNESGFHPALIKERLKQPQLYPTNQVKVFKTAALLARLTQPVSREMKGAKYFTAKALDPKLDDIFNVTYSGGIVFVHDPAKLKDAPHQMRLNISWIRNKTMEFDVIEILIINEPTETCSEYWRSNMSWSYCAEYASMEECTSPTSCGLATGGSSNVANFRNEPQRCTWRGDKIPSNRSTVLYSTCTPDIDTCPDGICDHLEELNYYICPQDCATDVLIPSEKNKVTGRGIARGTGVCTCGDVACQCNPIEYHRIETTTRKRTTPPTETSIINQTFLLQPNVSRHTGNLTAKILGIELAHCGTTCVLGIIAGALFLGGAVALVVICWRLDLVHKAVRNKFSNDSQDLSVPLSDYISRSMPDPLPLNFDMATTLADTAILSIINKYAPDPKWEFPRDQLIIEQTLGEGEFGKVLRAKASNIAGQAGHTTVAVKTLKDDARESELNDLLSEYQLLKEVSHPNVIRLLGVCTAPGGPIYLIIEFAEHGSLRNYLRRSRHLKSECGRLPTSTVLEENEIHYDEPNILKVTPKEILSFAWQICKGMAYLSEIKLVHRDLAARNVLLAADKICKISDFGLTRDIYEDDAYFKRSKGRVPVKWMAPESLSDHIYTNKSDVWSFGILVWELVTLGATPYPGIAVQNLFHLLRQGYRMERPDNCSPTLYNVMRSCWHIDPEQRPTFQQLSALWEKMLSDEVEYLDLANNAIHNRSYFCSPFEEREESVEKAETNPLNYMSKSQSYIKCGSADKFQETTNFLTEPDTNQNDINTQGYETPVKIPQKVQTPTNDCPQYYTDMEAGRTN